MTSELAKSVEFQKEEGSSDSNDIAHGGMAQFKNATFKMVEEKTHVS